MDISLSSSTIAGVPLTNIIYNASGCHCTLASQLDELNASQSGAVLTKSITLQPRKGNPTPNYHHDGLGSINSKGSPNMGFHYYMSYLATRNGQLTKPLIVPNFPNQVIDSGVISRFKWE